MGAALTPELVDRQGITGLSREDLGRACARGRRIKLVCEAFRDGAQVRAVVVPRELDLGIPSPAWRGPHSILRLHTDLMGRLSIVEESPGLTGTAYGVLADLLALVL